MKDLKEIVKYSWKSYQYAYSLNFKNVPKIIINSMAEDYGYSYYYTKSLHFKNVPLIIIKSALKYYYSFFTDNIKNFPENKHLLCYMLHFDKRMNILL